MAKVLSQNDIEYLENLSNKNTNDSMALYGAMKRLKNMSEDAFVHCGHLVCSYMCPANVAFLAFDLTCRQLEAGRNANPQKIFQPLSKNNRSSYEAVKPLYDNALTLIAKLQKQKEEEENNRDALPENIVVETQNISTADEVASTQDVDNNEEYEDEEYEDEEYEDDEEEYIPVLTKRTVYKPAAEDSKFATDFLYEQNFRSNDVDRYVVNTCIIPKSAWLINVYATTYEDYCNIVQNTLQELNDSGITVFLTKPDVFKKPSNSPRIAYSVLTGEKFNFASLSDDFVKALDDGDNMPISEGVKIANRATIQFASFIGPCYSDNSGGFSNSDKKYLSSFAKEEDILAAIEEIGVANNIVKHYIELRTGIPQSGAIQLYKSILCKKDDIMQIASLLRNIDGGKLDFIISSDTEDIEILFIHISHIEEFLSKIGSCGITIDLNPNFDELRM
jgi:hypothetical protein